MPHVSTEYSPRYCCLPLFKASKLLIGIGLVIAALLIFACILVRQSLSSPRFTQQRCDFIRAGMNESQVVRILGSSAGNYTSPGTSWIGSGPMIWWDKPEGCHLRDSPDETIKAWISDSGSIIVCFDKTGIVEEVQWFPVWVKKKPSPWWFSLWA